jgi:hypothetical protein
MNPEAEVDDVIATWVKATGSTLFTSSGEKPSRYFHIPGDPPHEGFQVTIFPPSNGWIVAQAAAIDTNDDTEMEMMEIFKGPVGELDALIAAAVATIEAWKQRRDPPSSGAAEWYPRPPNLWERIGGGILLAALLISVVSNHAGWRLFGEYDRKVEAGLTFLLLVFAYRIAHMVRTR